MVRRLAAGFQDLDGAPRPCGGAPHCPCEFVHGYATGARTRHQDPIGFQAGQGQPVEAFVGLEGLAQLEVGEVGATLQDVVPGERVDPVEVAVGALEEGEGTGLGAAP